MNGGNEWKRGHREKRRRRRRVRKRIAIKVVTGTEEQCADVEERSGRWTVEIIDRREALRGGGGGGGGTGGAEDIESLFKSPSQRDGRV